MENIANLLSFWEIPTPINITQVYRSAWDIDDTYILKNAVNALSMRNASTMNRLLLAKGIPVSEYLVTKDGQLFVLTDNGCYCLTKKIKETHMDPFSGDCRQNGRALGDVLARLHGALASIEPSLDLGIFDADFDRELNEWILPEINKQAIVFDLGVLEECGRIAHLSQTLPRQMIHRDMHPGNLLFDNGEFAGYLDFDISQRNMRVFDICYLGCSLLVDNYKDQARLERWRQLFRGVLEGYEALIPLTAEERDALPTLFVFDEVLFTAFFSSQGQAEVAQSCVEMTNWLHANLRPLLGQTA